MAKFANSWADREHTARAAAAMMETILFILLLLICGYPTEAPASAGVFRPCFLWRKIGLFLIIINTVPFFMSPFLMDLMVIVLEGYNEAFIMNPRRRLFSLSGKNVDIAF
jgi:hypothetical protein